MQQASSTVDRVIATACGSSHSVALVSCSGRNIVVAWGRAEDGQLGHGNADEQNIPRTVTALQDADVTSITCGAEYTVANCSKRREVYSWGWGDFGRLGHGDAVDVFVPRPIAALSGKLVTCVACGDTHTLVVLDGGKLLAFGRGQNGQLGLGKRDDSLVPQEVSSLSGKVVTGVSCGAEHSLCVTADGQVFAWGWGRYGNLGSGGKDDELLPHAMKGLEGVRAQAVASGWRHSMVVDSVGRVYTCGWSKYGQLGHGDARDRTVPTEVTICAFTGSSDSKEKVLVRQVTGGWRHTAAITSEGLMYAWGWNKFGQLGLNHCKDVFEPTLVSKLADLKEEIAMVSCGWRHTMVVTATGAVYSWGRGVNGQLGLGTNQDMCEPAQVKALSQGSIDENAFAHAVDSDQMFVAATDRYALVPDSHVPGSRDVCAVPVVPDCEDGASKRARLS